MMYYDWSIINFLNLICAIILLDVPKLSTSTVSYIISPMTWHKEEGQSSKEESEGSLLQLECAILRTLLESSADHSRESSPLAAGAAAGGGNWQHGCNGRQ